MTTVNATPKPITAVVTYSPGGGLDLSMRHLEKYLLEKKNLPVVFNFKVGAESLIGSQFVASSPKDGSVVGFTTLAGLAHVVKNSNLEFEYVSATRKYATVIVTNSNSDISNFNDLTAKLKQGRSIVFGSGTPAHQIQIDQLFEKNKPKVEQIIVPFKGAAPVVNAALGGHIDIAVIPAAVAKTHIESGKLRVIATTIRIPEYPSIVVLPHRYKGWLDMGGYGVILPKGTRVDVVDFWRNALSDYLTDPEVVNDFTKDWSDAYPTGEAEMKNTVEAIIKQLGKLKVD